MVNVRPRQPEMIQVPQYATLEKTERRTWYLQDFLEYREIGFQPVEGTVTVRVDYSSAPADGRSSRPSVLYSRRREGLRVSRFLGLAGGIEGPFPGSPEGPLPGSPEGPLPGPLPGQQSILPIDVELLDPQGQTVASQRMERRVDQLEFKIQAGSPRGEWKCRIINPQASPHVVIVNLRYPQARYTVNKTKIPIYLLSHAAHQLLTALNFHIRIHRGHVTLTFSREVAQLFGIPAQLETSVDALERVIDVNLAFMVIEPVVKQPVVPTMPAVPTIRLSLVFEEEGGEIDVPWYLPWADEDISNLAVVMDFELYGGGLLRDEERTRMWVELRVHSEAQFESDTIELIKGSLDGMIRGALLNHYEKYRRAVGRVLEQGMVDLARRGEEFYHISADNENFIIYTYDPMEGARAASASVISTATPRTVAVNDDGSIGNLGKVEHILVLMLENRSFDHMLGYLSLPIDSHGGRGRNDVDGLRGNESNQLPEFFGGPRQVRRLTETRFECDPNHSHEHTQLQINNGQMDGFVRSFDQRCPGVDQGRIMGYYTGDQLPTYDFLAANFIVCDRWFASHPGPTFPNRICALSGRTPWLENIEDSDPEVGYVRLPTVFDHLTANGISWAYYEHDVGFIRMFDRYRLDANSVLRVCSDHRHCANSADDLFRKIKNGQLPQVVFIDPNFVDIPPSSTATDDHPPADIRGAQHLVARLYEALRRSPTVRSKFLLIITYDEHGGFYDHVAPPGTARWAGPAIQVPPVHPQGPTYYGVRVPAFVVSAWVEPGVSSVVFDHTSTIKTILVKFFGRSIPNMSDRVNEANHLGGLLTRASARDLPGLTVPPMPEERRIHRLVPGDFRNIFATFGAPWMRSSLRSG